MNHQALDYLHFDYSEATDDTACFDTMASVGPAGLAALQTELATVLGWAFERFPDQRGPLDEGFAWDYDLQATQERSRLDLWQYDASSGRFQTALAPTEALRHTVSLSISGTAAFCAAFRERFVSADE